MSQKQAIKQSLQEIATLLYYMYDHYLKDMTKGQSLDALVAFLGDLGLLGNRISVFEAEKVRQTIMSHSAVAASSDSITYEQFYSWLRGISTIYYSTEVDSSRKALHMMLTKKIIPLASSWGIFRYSSCIRNGVNGAMLVGMRKHHIFLRDWYFHITQEPTQKITNDKEIWTKIIQQNSLVSLSSLMKHFEKTGLIPNKIESKVVRSFGLVLVKVQSDGMKKNYDKSLDGQMERYDEKQAVLSFSDFIQIVGFMSTNMDAYANRYVPHAVSQNGTHNGHIGYHVGWHVIIQSMSEYFLRVALEKWLVYEFDSNKYLSGPVPSTPSQLVSTSKDSLGSLNGGVLNKALGLSPSSLLWICRQGNLVVSHYDIYSLYTHIISVSIQYSEQSQSSLTMNHRTNSSIVPTSKIPTLLTILATQHDVTKSSGLMGEKGSGSKTSTSSSSIIYQAEDSYSQYTQSLIGSSDLAVDASIIAMSTPGLFFVSPQPLPSLLQALYSPRGARCMNLLSPSIQRILTEINDKQSPKYNKKATLDDNDEPIGETIVMVSLTKFLDVFRKSGVIPSLVTVEVMMKIASYVFGKEVHCDETGNDTGSLFNEREFIDLFFALSQVIFGGMTETFSPPSDCVILNRTIAHENTSEEIWEWHTALSNTEKLNQMKSSFSSTAPHIAIADRVDRLYCLLELVDPAACGMPLLERLDINNASKKQVPNFVIDDQSASLDADRVQDSNRPREYQSGAPKMLGKLLVFVFLECQKWANLHALSAEDKSSDLDNTMNTTFFQNILILIFLQYPSPVNTLTLTPWDIADMLHTSAMTRNDSNYEEDSEHDFSNLIMDLRFICTKNDISLDDFERFLSYLVLDPLSDPKPTGSLGYKLSITKLQQFFPYMLDVFTPSNLQMLQDGYPLLLWGYLRCCRGNSGHTSAQMWYRSVSSDNNCIEYDKYDLTKKLSKKYDFSKVNPLVEDVTTLFPSRNMFLMQKEYGVVSLDAAKSWALLQKISAEVCCFCFDLCVGITGDSVLHFSNFLIFCILCFYCQSNESEGSSAHSYLSTGQAVSELLKAISFNIHVHQKICSKKVLVSTILGVSTISKSHIEEVILLSAEVFQQLHILGKQRCQKKGYIDAALTQKLPPRPPLKLWDAPRFLGYCKIVGILPFIGSFSETWQCFGSVLLAAYPSGSAQGWGTHVVGTLPIQVTVAKIYEILGSVSNLNGVVSDSIDSMDIILKIVQCVIAPFLSGFMDDLISVSLLEERKKQVSDELYLSTYSSYISILNALEEVESKQSKHDDNWSFRSAGIDESNVFLEDMLRYGGDRTVASLQLLGPWISQKYDTLRPTVTATTRNKVEPSSLSISQFILSSQLLSLPSLSVIIKQSMSSRSVADSVDSEASFLSMEIGVSSTEFEEVLIRCAFSLWCDIGGLNLTMSDVVMDGHSNKIIAQIFDVMSSKFQNISANAIGKYCDECRYSFFQSKQNTSTRSRKSAFHESLNIRVPDSAEGHRSWGIDFLTPFCALLEETAVVTTQQVTVPPTPSQVFREPIRPKALRTEVSAAENILDFYSKEASENAVSNISNMLEAWGSDVTARRDNKTFDATKGLTNKSESSTEKLSTEKVDINLKKIFNVNGSNGTLELTQSSEREDSTSKIRDSMSPPLRTASGSPPSIVSRSEEMLAHILSMRTSTPNEPSITGELTSSSPRIDSSCTIRTPTPTPPLQQPQLYPSHHSSPSNAHDMQSEGINMSSGTVDKPLEVVTSPFSPTPLTFSSASSSPSPMVANNDALLEGTKEALWPVFATYCSCGDSSEPGKLSGPNLFALLSKLDLLTDETMISDLGVLLHQISAHSLSQTPSSMMGSSALHGNVVESEHSPLLSFEEFIVFLCAFAQLRFEGVVKLPSWSVSPGKPMKDSSKKEENWFAVCNTTYMSKSKSFKKLLEECVLPPLKKRLLLASPEDARHRDECSLIFSLETLFSIESVEKNMLLLFKTDQRNIRLYIEERKAAASQGEVEIEDPIVAALARIKIIPQIVSEHEVMQLIADILPFIYSNKTLSTSNMWMDMKFPQWQWVICVIAFKAVTFSIQKGQAEGKIKNLSSLVGEVITTMTAAMMT